MKNVKNSKEHRKELTLAFGSFILGRQKKDNGSEEKSTFTETLQRASAGERKHGEVSGRWSRSLAPTGGYSPQAAMGAPITAPGYKEDRKFPYPLRSLL